MTRSTYQPVSVLWVFALVFAAHAGVVRATGVMPKIPDTIRALVQAGTPQEVLVLLDDTAIQARAAALRSQLQSKFDVPQIQAEKARAYVRLKQRMLSALPLGEYDLLRDYSHLPLLFMRVRTRGALDRIAARSDVLAVYPNEVRYPILAQSLPLIGQPPTVAAGDAGGGATMLIIDTGVDYTRTEFGSCSAPGVPANCKVAYYANIADASTSLDTAGHGTIVSAVGVGEATAAKLAVVNVFGANTSTTDALIIDAINWGIANQATYNIVAVNMSLGGSTKYTSPCGNALTNPYVAAFNNARAAGMLPVAASGNSGYLDGLVMPACTPSAVSVGATYDANVGQVSYGSCTDATTAPDKVTCFSDSASFLTMLAPGSLITAAGTTSAGTSFSAPFVTAAASILRAAYPGENLNQTVTRMTTNGVPVTDARNGIVTPRLNLLAAARPANDAFANRTALGGTSGSAAGTNVLATKESGEPNHAGDPGGASVWWAWTAPASGQVSLDTHGSAVDTLLGVYTGTAVDALSAVAANDDDGSANGTSGLAFQAQAGTEYEIAIDGRAGVAGALALNWSLNTAAQADLALSVTDGPDPVDVNADLTYTITASNLGPNVATNVVVTDTLPAGASVAFVSPGCSVDLGVVTCGVGTIAANGSSLVTIVVRFAAAGSASNQATVASDLPDPNVSNDTVTNGTTIMLAAGPAADTDVPTLPQWGAALLGALLLLFSQRRFGRHRP
jgi:uncharacterized repeat protein (TIGR01451 family)